MTHKKKPPPPPHRFKPGRWIGRALLFLILVWLLWTAAGPLFYRPDRETPGGSPARYLKGAYHMHSTFSDGQADFPRLAKEAKKVGLDWIIVTDHGGPNPDSEKAGGWYDRILVIGASEASTDAGHLAVIGAATTYRLPFEPQLAIDEMNLRRGLSFIAHPSDDRIPWTDRSVEDFSGIEILSAYESVKRAPWHRYPQLPLQYLINSRYAVLNLLSSPAADLRLWDQQNLRSGPIYSGIFATDAHGKFAISKKLRLPFPSYSSLLSCLTVYVPRPNSVFSSWDYPTAAAWIVRALRERRFFNAVEAMASANGVWMTLEEPPDNSPNGPWQFRVGHRLAKPVELRLLRDGAIVHRQTPLTADYRVPLTQAGRYRAELRLPQHRFAHLPWVIGNPFDIPSSPSILPSPPIPLSLPNSHTIFKSIPWRKWTIETNVGSSYSWFSGPETAPEDGELSARYSLILPQGDRDAWCALALRDEPILKETLSPGAGVLIEIAADHRTVFWLDVRTRNPRTRSQCWYRHSLLVDQTPSTQLIPFSRMTPYRGTRQPLDPQLINSLFVSINNMMAFAPATGHIRLLRIGGYSHSPQLDK